MLVAMLAWTACLVLVDDGGPFAVLAHACHQILDARATGRAKVLPVWQRSKVSGRGQGRGNPRTQTEASRIPSAYLRSVPFPQRLTERSEAA